MFYNTFTHRKKKKKRVKKKSAGCATSEAIEESEEINR